MSYLLCLQHKGEWLLRIDDIDPPREVPGAANTIVKRLDRLGFQWSGPVHFQSRRVDAYRAAVAQLEADGLTYRCTCSRAAIAAHPESRRGRRYPGTCRLGPKAKGVAALRVRCADAEIAFEDAFQGSQHADLDAEPGDYVIWRKDNLPAYHLANVVDDGWLRITHVVRGADLLNSAGVHIHLAGQLGLDSPAYGHAPVLVGADGDKLSKQTGAEGIHAGMEAATILWTLNALGLANRLRSDFGVVGARHSPAPQDLWRWAAQHWDPATLRGVRQLPADSFGPLPQMH